MAVQGQRCKDFLTSLELMLTPRLSTAASAYAGSYFGSPMLMADLHMAGGVVRWHGAHCPLRWQGCLWWILTCEALTCR